MREEGYYWVKMSWGEWTIEQWDGNKWNHHGCQDGNDYYISFFQEIDEGRITRPTKEMEKVARLRQLLMRAEMYVLPTQQTNNLISDIKSAINDFS